MTKYICIFCLGVIIGSLCQGVVSAQTAERIFATLSTNLASGRGTPVTCTVAGTGCYLNVQTH